MENVRDLVRGPRNRLFTQARTMGIDLSEERQKPGSNQRSLAQAAKRMMNDGVPRIGQADQVTDNPPAGAFNSVNKTFTLSAPVAGVNIVIVFGHVTAGTTSPLARSASNPPATGEFYFDMNNPTTVILGVAPDPADAVIAVYKTTR